MLFAASRPRLGWATCPSCGKELPGEFPFCPFCAAPLTDQAAPSVHEERKVVSVLFCDLVGFTAASDAADPEDVQAPLREACALFASMGYKPALAETEALLGQGEAAAV